MKKIYFLILFSVCSTIIFAQTRTGQNQNITQNTNSISVSSTTTKAIGDTMMYFDGNGFYVNPLDSGAFNILNEDMDGLTVHQSGWTSKWMYFYSTDAADLQPTDIDTAYYIGSSSWFDPAGTSDDWYEMGPISVPSATGLKLTWKVKCNPGYRDGYKVWASSTGMSNYTNFIGTPLFTRTDMYPSNTQGTDTVWTIKTVDIPPSYNGGPVYIGFQHYAVDMDVLFFDEISLVEKLVTGIDKTNNDVIVNEIYPNPVCNSTMFSYQLTKNVNVNVDVLDMAGRLVISMPQGNQEAGTHRVTINAETLSNGTYFYTLTAGDSKTTKKMVVVK
jgi:hypothetical protein